MYIIYNILYFSIIQFKTHAQHVASLIHPIARRTLKICICRMLSQQGCLNLYMLYQVVPHVPRMFLSKSAPNIPS